MLTNRATLDFLISHLPLASGILSERESTEVMEGALLTLVKKDFASLKKFFTWFLEDLDESERPMRDDPAIRFVCPALQSLFRKFMRLSAEG